MSISRSAKQTNPCQSSVSLKVELERHNVHSINTRWDGTIMPIKKQPDENILDNWYYRQL